MADWRDGVRIVRADAVEAATGNAGRVTAFDFTEAGQRGAWIGAVAMAPGAATGGHHHGRHEVSVYVVAGHGLIRWGRTLEFGAEIGPGDFIYFTPHVPHEEVNLDPAAPLRFVVVRSDNERIVVPLDTAPVATPEMLA